MLLQDAKFFNQFTNIFSLASQIILVHLFDLVSAFSKSLFFYHPYNIILPNWSVLIIYTSQYLRSTVGPYNEIFLSFWE